MFLGQQGSHKGEGKDTLFHNIFYRVSILQHTPGDEKLAYDCNIQSNANIHEQLFFVCLIDDYDDLDSLHSTCVSHVAVYYYCCVYFLTSWINFSRSLVRRMARCGHGEYEYKAQRVRPHQSQLLILNSCCWCLISHGTRYLI